MNTKTLRFICTRVILAGFALWVISVVVFVVMELPEGNFVRRLMVVCDLSEWCWDGENATVVDYYRDYYGLNRPLYTQYGLWISRIVFKGDFGFSFYPLSQVRDLIPDRLILTLALLVSTSVFVWAASVPIGVYLAMRRRSFEDRVFTVVGAVAQSVPQLLLALLLMYFLFAFFGLGIGGLFSGEYINAPWSAAKVFDLLQHLVWPSVVLGAAGVARQARLLRDTLIDELDRPYLAAARARGAPAWRVIAKYPVRMAAARLIVGFRGLLPGLVSGSVIVSVVMSLPTLGPEIVEAVPSYKVYDYYIYYYDTYLYGAIFLVLCALSVVGALFCDLVLGAVDPRVRLRGSAAR